MHTLRSGLPRFLIRKILFGEAFRAFLGESAKESYMNRSWRIDSGIL